MIKTTAVPAPDRPTAELTEWLAHEAVEVACASPRSWEQLGELFDVLGVLEALLRQHDATDLVVGLEAWRAKLRSRGVTDSLLFPAIAAIANQARPSV